MDFEEEATSHEESKEQTCVPLFISYFIYDLFSFLTLFCDKQYVFRELRRDPSNRRLHMNMG